jgi:hypothetical protein
LAGAEENDVHIIAPLISTLAQATPPPETSVEIELSVWKWVIIIGVSAIIIIYAVKRISEVVVKKKTDTMIRRVVGEEAAKGEDAGWDDMKKLDEDLDQKKKS